MAAAAARSPPLHGDLEVACIEALCCADRSFRMALRDAGAADLVVRCIPHLRRYARALTKDVQSADDLVQDALERAWSRLHLWRGEGDIRPWLFSILHSIHVDGERHRRRSPPFLRLVGELPVAGVSNPEATAELREVFAAFDRLAEEQRQVLLLVVLEQFSYQQVADILGIPLGTVMSRLFRARERLRLALRSPENLGRKER
jgi:RNA polymerase sigma-70 factor, ECF subfamily